MHIVLYAIAHPSVRPSNRWISQKQLKWNVNISKTVGDT